MRREHLSWIILAAVWLAVSIVARAFIDAMELHSWERYVAYVPIILLLWYSANRIMDWGRQRPRNAK